MIILEELNLPDARRVVLDGHDMPFAEERTTPAFESGGKLQKERIDLPGGRTIFHVIAAPERPWVIRGAFLDWFSAAGHARAQRDALLALWRRANLLRITWGDQVRTGLLDEPKFGEESEGAISYELTFEVAEGVGGSVVPADTEALRGSDLAAVLRTRLAARRAALARAPIERSLLAQMLGAVDAGIAALDDVQREADALDRTVGRAAARARRVLAVTQRAQNLLASAQGLYRTLNAQVNASAYSAATAVATWKEQFAGGVELADVLDGLRALRASARARARQRVRLYRVKPGDTLEAIARAELGSAARASELGLRADELTPGRLIQLPEGS